MRFIGITIVAMLLPWTTHAGTYTLTYPAAMQGENIPAYDVETPDRQGWLTTADPAFFGTGVGPGNPGYDGTNGIAFPGRWSIGYALDGRPNYISVTALSFTFGPNVETTGPLDVTVAAANAGASWDLSVVAPGTYSVGIDPNNPVIDDAFIISATAPLATPWYDIESISITYTQTMLNGPTWPFVGGGGDDGGGGGGQNAVPEPSGFILGMIGLALAGIGVRRN